MSENGEGSFRKSLQVDQDRGQPGQTDKRQEPGMGQIAAQAGLALALTLYGCGYPNHVQPISEGGGPSNGHTIPTTDGYSGLSNGESIDKLQEQRNIIDSLTHLIAETAGIPEWDERTKVIYKVDTETGRPRIAVTTDNSTVEYASPEEWGEYEKNGLAEEMKKQRDISTSE